MPLDFAALQNMEIEVFYHVEKPMGRLDCKEISLSLNGTYTANSGGSYTANNANCKNIKRRY